MTKRSAGILMYRHTGDTLEVLLVHPGGPFWAKKDDGAWSIPKGEYEAGEDPFHAAQREFAEETGCAVDGPCIDLGVIEQRNRKVVAAWAIEGTCAAGAIRSNTFVIEWPPKSARRAEFPEVDRAEWFTAQQAAIKLVAGQGEFIDRLRARLGE